MNRGVRQRGAAAPLSFVVIITVLNQSAEVGRVCTRASPASLLIHASILLSFTLYLAPGSCSNLEPRSVSYSCMTHANVQRLRGHHAQAPVRSGRSVVLASGREDVYLLSTTKGRLNCRARDHSKVSSQA